MHPKFVKAGFWGATITRAAWSIAKEFDRPDGDITNCWTPLFMSRWANMDEFPDREELARKGMDAAVAAGLIDETDDGGILVHDWDEIQRSACNAERQRRYRVRKKGEDGEDGEEKEEDGEEKKEKEEKVKRKKKEKQVKPTKVQEESIETAVFFIDQIVDHNPKHAFSRLKKAAREKKIAAWAKTLDRMNRLDGAEWSEIREVIAWSTHHEIEPNRPGGFPGWATNCMSPESLRGHWDQLKAQMRSCNGGISKPQKTSKQVKESSRRAKDQGFVSVEGDSDDLPF
jgi:hypothetical protein